MSEPAPVLPTWRQRFWANTTSSYVYLVVRLAVGLLVFRLLFNAFPAADFGFWTVLWSVLGFGIIIDLGFGTTVQRATARFLAKDVDAEHLNRLVATIFAVFLGLGLVFFAGAMAVREPVLERLGLPAGDLDRYRTAYRDFFLGLIPLLPLGLLPEILRGLHRSALINWLSAINSLAVYGCAVVALAAGWGLVDLMRLVVVLQLVPNAIALLAVHRLIPTFSLAPRWWSLSALREQLRFSLASYAIACSAAALAALDNLLMTALFGLLAVPTYVAGAKVADLLTQTVRQLYGALPAAAAEMHARGDRAQVAQLLLLGYRLTWVVATPLYVLALLHLDPLLHVLTGVAQASPQSRTVGMLLLTGAWAGAVVGGCGRRLLLLCGHHRAMMVIALVHLGAAVVLGAGLGWWMGPSGVALGSVLAGLLAGALPVVPLVMRTSGLDAREVLRVIGGDLATFGLAFALPTAACGWWWPSDSTTTLPGMLARGAVCVLPMALFVRRLRGKGR